LNNKKHSCDEDDHAGDHADDPPRKALLLARVFCRVVQPQLFSKSFYRKLSANFWKLIIIYLGIDFVEKLISKRHKARQQFLGRENMRPKNRCLAF